MENNPIKPRVGTTTLPHQSVVIALKDSRVIGEALWHCGASQRPKDNALTLPPKVPNGNTILTILRIEVNYASRDVPLL